MVIKYINSQKKEFDFLNANFRIRDANFHNVAWTYKSVAKQYGVKVRRFEKEPINFELVFELSGTTEKRKEFLNELHAAMEMDKITDTPGRIVWNDSFIEGYFLESSTYPADNGNKTINEAVFFAPYPFWVKDIERKFFKKTSTEIKEGLDYNYDYDYDYAPEVKGRETWNTRHYAPSDFVMTIYGPCADPRVTVNDYIYEVYDTVEKGDYIVIKSRDNSVVKYRSNRTTVDLYDFRRKEKSIFEKIPGGVLGIEWSGDFSFDLKLLQERSEPAW